MNVSFCLLLFKFELFIIIFFFFGLLICMGFFFCWVIDLGCFFFFCGQIKIGPAGPSLKLPNENKI